MEPDDRIAVTCPACGRVGKTARANIGKSGRCRCGYGFVVTERHTHECPACEQQNPPDASVCVRCGRALSGPVHDQPRPTRAGSRGKLEWISGTRILLAAILTVLVAASVVVVLVLPQKRQWSVLRDEMTHDTPIRRQIEIDLLIRKPMPKKDILALLQDKYADAASRDVFTDGQLANCVVVSAYPSIDHYRSREVLQRVAYMQRVPASTEPTIEFNEVLHQQMFAAPEIRHGLSEEQRKRIYRDAVAADLRAWDEAEEKYPLDPELLPRPGDTLEFTESLFLMGSSDAEEWFKSGCPSVKVPPGTTVTVLRVVERDLSRWAEVAAYLPGEAQGYQGWIVATALGSEYPIWKDKDKFSKWLNRQRAYAGQLEQEYRADVLADHGITQEVADAILEEGSSKQWPWPH